MAEDDRKPKLKKPKMVSEFKDFIIKGNVLAMAIGIIIGIAFGAVIKSAVDDILMPPIGLALGGADFTDSFMVLKEGKVFDAEKNATVETKEFDTLQQAKDAGAITLRYGIFINALINFLIIGIILFFITKAAARMEKKKEEAAPTTKPCPYCDTQISLKATKCPNCTSKL
jgi:large conductance mechanosensitive channel